ncbi:hypothetical protein BS47DRAFT_1399828 [Hydnum rufescens UP504]|uniref:G domain-containing protein n=1 Tax=Hydnum rufescens UP504 TaxID=1448309 RepID=A0A9P6AIQ7_9AGAM|nr:hypothetical protein BS47DRAFT_1399828 [Hydnum rufescens UP504]
MWTSIRKHVKHPKKLTKKVPDGEVPDEEVPAEDRRIKRFRILILGPANAGKTTLLERLTDSPAGAAIVKRNGKRVITTDTQLNRAAGLMHPFLSQIKEVPRGYDQRGIHNIDDEITYASNPDFVFHDSGGFEAGGVEELQAVWKFIQKRSLASPSQQLHAIWLCIPTDNDRPFGFLQSGFFSEPTASVPVIGIFTKLDGRETKVRSAVFDSTASPSDFLGRVAEVKQKVAEFVHGLETQFQKERYPPAGFARVGSMYTLSEE